MSENFEVRLSQALEQHRAGRADLAEPVYRQLFEENPGNAELNHLLGIIELAKDRHDQAEVFIAQAIRRDETQAKYHNTLGALLRRTGRDREARDAYLKALQIEPGFIDALHNLGEVYRALGEPQKAESCFREILEAAPDNVDALNNLAALGMASHRYEAALTHIRRADALAPGNPTILINLLKCLERMNLLEEASEVIFRLEASGSDIARGRLIAAQVERRTGREVQAAGSLRRLLQSKPNDNVTQHALFELGLVLDRTDHAEEAFSVFAQANALQKKRWSTADIDPERYLSHVARGRNWATPERLKIWDDDLGDDLGDNLGDDSPAPVFLVGFPRSGVTLIEQVLRAHPGIVTSGEASPLERLKNHLHQQGNYPECLESVGPDDVKKWRRLYQDYSRDIFGQELEGRLPIDKMPLNIAELALINRIFPKAKIITAVRDPRDVCLSCLMQDFQPGDAMANFNDLQSTVRLYTLIMEFWQHCRENMALAWCEFKYEDLVADYQVCTRQILDFIDIPWSDDIDQYRAGVLARPITTTSFRDMVNPMYNRGVGRWRAYRQHLEPVYQQLEPFIRDFDYNE